MNTEELVNLYLNECFEKTNNETDILKFETIWRCLCNNPEYFNKLIKRKNIILYLNKLPGITYSANLHSNYLRGWRPKDISNCLNLPYIV